MSFLLECIPKEDLDRELTGEELASFAKHLVDWPEKARGLGLEESDIDEIREDKNKSRLRKRAVLRRWKEIYGDRATLRELIRIAEQKGWRNFVDKVGRELGLEDGK